MSDKKKAAISYAGLAAVAMIWGLSFAAVKSSLDYITPIYMMAMRFTMAALLMVALCLIRKRFRLLGYRDGSFNKGSVKHGITIGIFLFFAYITQTIGCNYTTAGKNAFLTAFYIIAVPFMHWFLSKKRPKMRLFIAALTGLTGIGLISLNGDMSVNIGDVLTLICGIFFAIQIALIDRYSENDDPVILALLQMSTVAVLSIICAPVFEGSLSFGELNREAWTGILYLGIMSTFVGFLFQTIFQKYTRPEPASLIMSSEAVFGVLGSVLLLKETVSRRMLLGCAVMLAAIVLAQVEGKGKKSP